jgi:hypothetical protein
MLTEVYAFARDARAWNRTGARKHVDEGEAFLLTLGPEGYCCGSW